jgi:hypothetical protein
MLGGTYSIWIQKDLLPPRRHYLEEAPAPGSVFETVDLARIRADVAQVPPQYSSIKVVYGDFPPPVQVLRGNFRPTYITDDGTLPPGDTGTLIAGALGRTADRLSLLMPGSVGPMRIKVTFAGGLPAGEGPLTQVVYKSQPLQTAMTWLRDAYDTNSEIGTEGQLYQFFPLNATIPVKFRQSTIPVAVSNVLVPAGLYPTLLQPLPAGTFESLMTLNNAAFLANRFNLEPRKGRIANRIDIDGMLFHETCHALGFDTNMDNPNVPSALNRPTVCDLFRLDASIGGNISNAVWQDGTIPRMLYPGTEANYITGLGTANWSFRASTGINYPTGPDGDGFGAAHWKHVGLLPAGSPRIGILDPIDPDAVNANPALPRISGYFTEADLRAITTIGWNLNVAFSFPGPGDFPVVPPATFPTLASLSPSISWASSSGADKYHVTLYRKVNNLLIEVHHIEDVVDTTYQFPAGLFAAARHYHIYVVAENPMGFGFSPAFECVAPGLCSTDFDGSGTVNIDDIFIYLNAFFAGTQNADYDENGQVSIDDLFIF